MNLELDSARDHRNNSDSSQADLLNWLGQLQATDSWRVHNPTTRVFSGPLPRINRLDYIFISEDLHCELYGSSRYFQPRHGGDHLAHEVTLAPPKQLQGRGYWRFPRYLLEYPQIVEGIKREVDQLVPVITQSTNPGIVWQTWKNRMKSLLQRACQRIREEKQQVLTSAQDCVEQAAARLREHPSEEALVNFELAREYQKEVLEMTKNNNQDVGFDVQVKESERSTSFFFRPPSTHLRRTPIESVQLADGSESRDANVISTEFCKHWGEIMGAGFDDDSDQVQELPVPTGAQDKLLSTISRKLTDQQRDTLDSVSPSWSLLKQSKKCLRTRRLAQME